MVLLVGGSPLSAGEGDAAPRLAAERLLRAVETHPTFVARAAELAKSVGSGLRRIDASSGRKFARVLGRRGL
jgi:hypothetical protein